MEECSNVIKQMHFGHMREETTWCIQRECIVVELDRFLVRLEPYTSYAVRCIAGKSRW